jgi:hypothetical protein
MQMGPEEHGARFPSGGPPVPEEYAGQWVAWNEARTEILAHDPDLQTARQRAVAAGCAWPVMQRIFRVPQQLRWYQFSLRSMLISVAVVCLLLWLNTRPYSYRGHWHVTPKPRPGRPSGGFTVLGDNYGWPLTYRFKPCQGLALSASGAFDRVYWLGLMADIIFGAAILVATVTVSDRGFRPLWHAIRSRFAGQGDRAGRSDNGPSPGRKHRP